jgi:23S rRNA pseudouridine2605 synthase
MNEKLQKLLAHAGLGSRRELETWITAGRITVNGKQAKLGDRAHASDRILVDGKLLHLTSQQQETIKALIYHKPEGQICTRSDPQGRPSVFENLPAISGGRWVSIGRLDINSSGLLLFTNNGNLANRLMHPSTGVEREYLVRIRGRASEETINKLTRKGVVIDGKPAHFQSVIPADLAEEGSNHWYRVVICEGRNREVRRMWDAVNHTVSRLKRIRYGTVKLTRDLKQGQHAKIAPKQLEKLVTSVGLDEEFHQQLYSGSRNRASNGQVRARKTSAASPKKPSRSRSAAGPQKRGSKTDRPQARSAKKGRSKS